MACSGNKGCGRNGDCSTNGCSRINFFDWLDNMLPPGTYEQENVYEVKFRSMLKGYYKNVNGLDLYAGDLVVVESERGYDIGTVSIGGQLVQLQLKKNKIKPSEIQRIYRKATEEDLKKCEELQKKEYSTLIKTREVIKKQGLDMKLSEVHYQADGSKATFFYIADGRVDFRELIKILAEEFKTRIEMRQIGLRQESALMGGIGSCGRVLCCASWLSDFKNVTTASARYQNIALNPSKITGLCGRLKCCLNYELEVYLDALNDFPDIKQLETEIGVAVLQKVDIFKKMMWFGYPNDDSWVGLTVQQVKELLALNKKGIKPPTLSVLEEEIKSTKKNQEPEIDFVDVVGQSKLNLKDNKPKNVQQSKSKSNAHNSNEKSQYHSKNNQKQNLKQNNQNKSKQDHNKKKN